MELRISRTFLYLILPLIALFVIYRALPGGDLTCSSLGDNSYRWMVEASVIFNNESTPLRRIEDSVPEKLSIAQFLQQKVGGDLLRYQDEANEELAGLDYSTRALLVELLRSISSRSAVAAPEVGGTDNQEDWGLLNFDYGVARVVRRLVVCSAYRTSLREFTVITLSPDFTLPTSNPDFKNFRKEPALKRSCTWLAGGNAGAPSFGSAQEMNETGRASVGNGSVEFRWIGETHGTSYDIMLIHCTFPEVVGTDKKGGILYLNVTHGLGNSAPTELAPVYRERPETLKPSLYKFPREFQYEFAYCSGPVFTTLAANHVKQFLMYHYALLGGSVHFFIYDSHRIDGATMAVLQPLIDAGSLTIVNFRKESEYDTWYHSQDLALNDCLYRTRDLARWILSWDMDEYLLVRPPQNLTALLEKHKDAPWISFGKIDFALNRCAANESAADWAVERMVYRQANPICGPLCNGDKGARKWMANPRKIKAGRIHAVADNSKGVVLSTDEARMNHYRGLVAPRGQFNCEYVLDPITSNPTKAGTMVLWSDSELASLVSSTLRSSVEALPMFS